MSGRYALMRLEELLEQVTAAYESYELHRSTIWSTILLGD